MVVDDAFDRVERDGEACAAPVDVEIHDVAVGRDVLDLPEPEQVGTVVVKVLGGVAQRVERDRELRSEEHTSELQSQSNLVCRLLLEKKKKKEIRYVEICSRKM